VAERLGLKAQHRLLAEAHRQGLLEPLYQWLEDHRLRFDAPVEPQGPEWPFVRAYHDGRKAEADALVKWINRTVTMDVSPDGAENTED
jgi:hypothetical protein